MEEVILLRILGIWLILGGFSYLAISFTGLLWTQYEDLVSNIAFPGMLGELATILWLVIMGAKEQPVGVMATAA